MVEKESLITLKETIVSYVGFTLWVIVLLINNSITGGQSYNIYLWVTGACFSVPTLIVGISVALRYTRLMIKKYVTKVPEDQAAAKRRDTWKDVINQSHLPLKG